MVIGLDGATLDLVEPWARAGRLPHLAGLMARGAWGTLRSTVPAATFPAWTSLVTGVNPGRHGILDFTRRTPGSWHLEFTNRTHRRVPALWNRLEAAGRRVAVLTVPGTYPPEPLDGVMVSGWDSPLATGIDGSFVHPRSLWPEIRSTVGRLPFADFQEIATGPGWHETARDRLLDGVARRGRLATWLLARRRLDALMVVFGESDTVAHHFWRFHDRASPRWEASPFAGAIGAVYEAIDAAIGAILAVAGAQSLVAVVSDHGSGGAGDRALHLNRRLAEDGLLGFRAPGRAGLLGVARTAALRLVPHRLQGAVARRAPRVAGRLEAAHRFAGIAWERTVAYSEELDYHPSVWLNLRGREPEGVVAPRDYRAVRTDVAATLREWRDDGGRPVLARVLPREEVFDGPALEEAPDLLLEPALVDGYSPSCRRSDGPGPALRRLARSEFGGGRGQGMNGAHRRDGLFVLAGPGVAPVGRVPGAEIVDALPTLLALAGLPVPDGLDGVPIGAALATPPRRGPDEVRVVSGAPVRLDAAATSEIAARLAALGYVDA